MNNADTAYKGIRRRFKGGQLGWEAYVSLIGKTLLVPHSFTLNAHRAAAMRNDFCDAENFNPMPKQNFFNGKRLSMRNTDPEIVELIAEPPTNQILRKSEYYGVSRAIKHGISGWQAVYRAKGVTIVIPNSFTLNEFKAAAMWNDYRAELNILSYHAGGDLRQNCYNGKRLSMRSTDQEIINLVTSD